jgi:putative membrane protein
MIDDATEKLIELTTAEKLAVERTDLAADRNRLAADRTNLATDRTRLAYSRTLLAHESVMMGWITTAMSLIIFGFTIYKFFQLELRGGAPTRYLISAREYGLAMVVIGLVSLLAAAWEYRSNTRKLRAECPDAPRSIAGIVAALAGILGVVALIVMLLRQ